MPMLKWPSEIANMLVNKLSTDLVAYGFQPDAVYYGDRDPAVMPAVTVEVTDLQIDLGAGTIAQRTERGFAAYLMVYYAKYADAEATRQAADACAETVCGVLNNTLQWPDISGNQQIVKGWVTRLQPGYATRNKTLLYVARITWEAMTITPI